MPPAPTPAAEPRAARALGAAFVALAVAAYYWLFLLPPRLLGSADPDRYYHLALSRLYAQGGFRLRTLPQVEDLNWGHYFPDKEFLFHVLTGGAWAVGGDPAVLWLVPLIGLAVALLLYLEISRVLRALPAALLAVVGLLGSSAFLFRMSLLRPHMLAVLCFVLLLLAILRQRPRLAALAALAFALSYHAFYVVGVVVVAAWLLRRQEGMAPRTWAWVLGGLCLGLLLNPYFPSNVLMGVFTLKLALGLATLPAMEETLELFQPSFGLVVVSYGFVLACVVACAVAGAWKKPAAGAARTQFLFVLLVAAAFAALGLKSLRAMEYAVPAALLLAAHASALRLLGRYTLAALLAVLLLCQGWIDARVYRVQWSHPQLSLYGDYAPLLRHIPPDQSLKVFNCEWESGPFILYERPKLRFVDLLEPALLWQADPQKYTTRQGLVGGAFADPRAVLRGVFHADMVLCGPRGRALVRQMQANPRDFRAAPGTENDEFRLFLVRPDEVVSPASPK